MAKIPTGSPLGIKQRMAPLAEKQLSMTFWAFPIHRGHLGAALKFPPLIPSTPPLEKHSIYSPLQCANSPLYLYQVIVHNHLLHLPRLDPKQCVTLNMLRACLLPKTLLQVIHCRLHFRGPSSCSWSSWPPLLRELIFTCKSELSTQESCLKAG